MTQAESNTRDLLQSLQSVKLFQGVSQGELAAFLSVCRKATFRAGEVIFDEGSRGTELFIVTKGRVGVEVSLDDGVPELVFEAKRDDIFGELGLLDTHTRAVTARSVGETGLRVVSRSDFFGLVSDRPPMGLKIMTNLANILSERLRGANRRFRQVSGQQSKILELVNLTLT